MFRSIYCNDAEWSYSNGWSMRVSSNPQTSWIELNIRPRHELFIYFRRERALMGKYVNLNILLATFTSLLSVMIEVAQFRPSAPLDINGQGRILAFTVWNHSTGLGTQWIKREVTCCHNQEIMCKDSCFTKNSCSLHCVYSSALLADSELLIPPNSQHWKFSPCPPFNNIMLMTQQLLDRKNAILSTIWPTTVIRIV